MNKRVKAKRVVITEDVDVIPKGERSSLLIRITEMHNRFGRGACEPLEPMTNPTFEDLWFALGRLELEIQERFKKCDAEEERWHQRDIIHQAEARGAADATQQAIKTLASCLVNETLIREGVE